MSAALRARQRRRQAFLRGLALAGYGVFVVAVLTVVIVSV